MYFRGACGYRGVPVYTLLSSLAIQGGALSVIANPQSIRNLAGIKVSASIFVLSSPFPLLLWRMNHTMCSMGPIH